MRAQCEKSAKILASFLADPQHPESALNAIPKEVLRRAKGSVFLPLPLPFDLSSLPASLKFLEPSESRKISCQQCLGSRRTFRIRVVVLREKGKAEVVSELGL